MVIAGIVPAGSRSVARPTVVRRGLADLEFQITGVGRKNRAPKPSEDVHV
jgi:hypothetical protein